MKRNVGVDIIIPVYNALEDLKLCVESILKHTDLTVDRLLLIDDKSPDTNVYPYMKALERPGVVVLQNESNEGFSGTINKGIQFSDRDVLLLNSDTVVTEKWIDKIVACAYSDSAIGTVTPFSNNATLCSVPYFCQENSIPNGMTIDEYAHIIERCSMKVYPKITVAVGFCMFIKRETLNAVGLFDKETFQRGYGEENDFCWRAEQLGYYHVLCDDTYIYHSGSSSFLSEEKKKLIAAHESIIRERYPKLHQKNAEYVRDNPHQYLRDNIAIYTKLQGNKRNILYVLHADFRSDTNNNIGGTQFHVKDLVMHYRQENNVFVLARDGKMLRLTAYVGNERLTFGFRVGEASDYQQFFNAKIAEVLRQILGAFSIDLVHVQHVSGLSFDVFQVVKDMGIPLLATLHDFFYICPTVKLLENGSHYCGGKGENCAQCLNGQICVSKQVDYLSYWQKKCIEALSMCDALIAPSESAKEIYAKTYPELAERIRVIGHGMDSFTMVIPELQQVKSANVVYQIEKNLDNNYVIAGWAYQEGIDSRNSDIFVRLQDKDGAVFEYLALMQCRPDISSCKGDYRYLYSGFQVQIPDMAFCSGPLQMQLIIRNEGNEYCSEILIINNYIRREKNRRRIAFLGGLNEAKGSKIASQMIQQSGNLYDWYIIGGIGDPGLATLEKKNVQKTNWYKRENISLILRQNQIDLVCILPIWPETFCYTVSEAQLAGIPILTTDIGALGERMRHDQTGWLVEKDTSAKDILNRIARIFDDPVEYQKVFSHTESFSVKTISQMCAEYADLYSEFSCPDHSWEFDPKQIYQAYNLCLAVVSGTDMDSDGELLLRVNELEATLSGIEQSLEYRMLRFFNREKLPFKRQIKWLIGFAYRVYVKLFRK